MSSSVSALFQPLPVGAINVGYRIVMAPLTRFRANKVHVHSELAKTYYTQRVSVPGTLLVSEATFISPKAGGHPNAPAMRRSLDWKAVRTTSRFAMFWEK
jgi:NADPH2 dehydrogenase